MENTELNEKTKAETACLNADLEIKKASVERIKAETEVFRAQAESIRHNMAKASGG